jgi:ABC-2 type transport system permease protein
VSNGLLAPPAFASTVWVIAQKELTLLVRDRGALFWAGVFPILFAVLFGAVFPSQRAPERLAVAWSGPAAVTPALEAGGLSVREATLEEGRALVRRGEVVAAIDGRGEAIELVTDPTHPAEATVVELMLTRAVSASRCGAMPAIHRSLAGASAAPTGFAMAFPAAVLWGLIGCAGTFASAIVGERKGGTHQRLRAAPISNAALLGGKLLACLIACVVDAALLLLIARIFFGVHVERFSSLPLAIGACAVCFAGMTVLLGVMGRNEQSVGGAAWATLLLFAMVGGAMVPLSVMPSWLRTLSAASPVKWGIVVLEGATVRGLDARELLPACAALVAVGLLSLASAAIGSRAT